MTADANALLILCADRIVDGTGRPALEKGFVALRQDRIQELGTSVLREGWSHSASLGS
jgi:hypothetical protein